MTDSSKIKVGSFIKLPSNNFKPNKKPSKQINKLPRNPKSIQTRISNTVDRSIVQSASRSSLEDSSNTINFTTSLSDSTNLNDEEKEKKVKEFVDKIKAVFNKKLIELKYKRQIINEQIEKEICSVVPPFEIIIQDKIDSELRRRKFFKYLKEDDYLIGRLIADCSKSKSDTKKACFELICFDGCKRRLIHDLALHAYYLIEDDSMLNELQNEGMRYFRFRVHKVIREQIFVTFNHSTSFHDNLHLKLGIVGFEDLPEHFKKVIYLNKKAHNQTHEEISSFDNLIQSNKQYQNPFSVDYLLETLQIDEENFFKKFDKRITDKISEDLRAGIDCLKKEKYDEAELLLCKVIKLEPRNADAHVGIGCAFANQFKYEKAIEKFEFSLKLDDKHLNARKYLISVLMANARKLCKQNDYTGALESYRKVLIHDPANDEAEERMRSIETKCFNLEERKKSKKFKPSSRSPQESSKRKRNS